MKSSNAAESAASAAATEELLKKIQELEVGQVRLQQEMSQLMASPAAAAQIVASDHRQRQRPHSISPQRVPRRRVEDGVVTRASFRHSSPLHRESSRHWGPPPPSAVNFTDKQYLNILQSMGQSIHIMDPNNLLIYWNKRAEELYGYSSEEAIGSDALEIITDPQDHGAANEILRRGAMGENWTGLFPVKTKSGIRFSIVATNTPMYDDTGLFVGVICVSNETRPYEQAKAVMLAAQRGCWDNPSNFSRPRGITFGKLSHDSQQPLQVAIASKISNLATKVSNKVKSKMRPAESCSDYNAGIWEGNHPDQGFSDAAMFDHRDDGASSGASTPRGDPLGVFSRPEDSPSKQSRDSGDENERKPSISKILSSKAEAWMEKKGLALPWKEKERESTDLNPKVSRFVWPWEQDGQQNGREQQNNASSTFKQESPCIETNRTTNNAAAASWCSSVNVNSSSSGSSGGSTSSGTVNKRDVDTDSLDYEILWEDLTIGEQVGQGSCGTVYHALWYGSDVAVKVFSRLEYSDEVISSFRQEVSLMKRLRHPNILLFMGAVMSPECLGIVTEFLPRGSLFRLLQKSAAKLEWRRRIHMALDIARGMNYLHHHNPPIVHRDLKSSNLLVDRNWTVKVGDFGLSRLKNETYLLTKTGKGTPQWMAPEVLRNEPADEKSDIYSFGVILWELITQKIPWENLNSMQVIGAVGFMNQHLDIPDNVDGEWASIIQSCWDSEPHSRPSFQELVDKLKEMQKRCAIQHQAERAGARDAAQK
ncbi:serine/threonine-protein kinase BCK1/SLK1/SSP31-like isoform X1 [Salvia hispanica]|uniref:serine/threonine-protein kinase BCK1/SLK1/SSP31-like isoform X1 n=2 Tax=Salvia hispanica TaxID=49212 RepID=UPI002008EFBD|nr:serine/threonine-protein kinase BCK1/SLK1/SSP31-like isoform X1 [Salvia hispanica]XP_047980354.1 serine/threonine-protein kinase BCK1/SLK1/SSP31-like isoform X1 [Salvia hispanica]